MVFKRLLPTALACAAVFAVAKPTVAEITQSQPEPVQLLSKYIAVDTTNPPGNERRGAEFLAAVLKENGIESQLFDTQPNRAVLYARLKGTGKKRPLILLNHIDVVPANAADWDHPPFSGSIVNGEIWGRGAIDMKSLAIAELEVMLQAKRCGKPLDRDLIFVATPDEEVGGTYGAEWIAKNHPELVRDAEYLINEGFFIDAADDGKAKYWGVDCAEKSVLWLKVTAHGDAGHASMPMPDSAPNRLVRGLARLVNEPPAPNVLPAVKEYFTAISSTEAEPARSQYKNIEASVRDKAIYSQLLKNKLRSSMLRDTVSLTVLKAGYKTNVIPAEASAELDCRLLPTTDKDKFVEEVKRILNDPSLDVTVIDWVHAQASPWQTPLFETIKAVANKEQPGIPVVPVVVPWFTDSHWFREFGTVAYGFMPFEIDQAHLATMHGKNERIPVDVFMRGVERLNSIVTGI